MGELHLSIVVRSLSTLKFWSCSKVWLKKASLSVTWFVSLKQWLRSKLNWFLIFCSSFTSPQIFYEQFWVTFSLNFVIFYTFSLFIFLSQINRFILSILKKFKREKDEFYLSKFFVKKVLTYDWTCDYEFKLISCLSSISGQVQKKMRLFS